MSFFTTSTGENLAQNQTGSFSLGGDDFAPIPKGTRVLAIVDEAKIEEYNGRRNIKIKWDIAQPKEYKGRKIFQKIKCYETDSKTRDNARRMLAAIDANAGGKLAAANAEPTDQSLSSALCAKMMVLKLGVWTIKEDDNKQPLPESEWKSGNFVQEVSKHNPQGKPAAQPVAQQAPVAQPTTSKFDDMDAEIPF